MSLPRSVADVIDQHVTLELYLNVYQPHLQTPTAVFWFLRQFHGRGAVSPRKMKAITERFLNNIHDYAEQNHVPIIPFEKGQRKEET